MVGERRPGRDGRSLPAVVGDLVSEVVVVVPRSGAHPILAGGVAARQTVAMPSWTGPAIIVVILLVLIPVGVMMSGGVAAGILGYFAKKDVDEEFEGTEYIDLS